MKCLLLCCGVLAAMAGQAVAGDQIYIHWATLLAGWGQYYGGVAVDASGNTFVTGKVSDLQATMPQATNTAHGNTDAFVAKLNSDGTLAWYTYVGGSGDESGMGIAVDSAGNALVTGGTSP